MGEWNKNIGTG